MFTLIDQIEMEVLNDDGNLEDQSLRLLAEYNAASEAEKAKIDNVLICICGYSMNSLLEKLRD